MTDTGVDDIGSFLVNVVASLVGIVEMRTGFLIVPVK